MVDVIVEIVMKPVDIVIRMFVVNMFMLIAMLIFCFKKNYFYSLRLSNVNILFIPSILKANFS